MKKHLYAVAIAVFAIGVIAGLWLGGVTTVANLEASVYFGYYGYADRPVAGVLKCPAILKLDEVGKISLTIHNQSDRAVEPIVKVLISDSKLLMRSLDEQAPVPSGETRTLEWDVSKDDVVYGSFIMAKAQQLHSFGNPARVGNCGIFVVSLPWLTGNQILIATIVVSVLCMLTGIAVFARWPLSDRPAVRQPQYALGAVAIGVALAMVFGVLGLWVLGIIVCAVSTLLIIEVTMSFLKSGLL